MHFVYNMCAGYIDLWPRTFARRARIAIIDEYNLRSRQKAINPHCPTDPMWRERESNTDQRDIEQLVHGEEHRHNVSKADSRTDPTLVTALIRYIYKELADGCPAKLLLHHAKRLSRPHKLHHLAQRTPTRNSLSSFFMSLWRPPLKTIVEYI